MKYEMKTDTIILQCPYSAGSLKIKGQEKAAIKIMKQLASIEQPRPRPKRQFQERIINIDNFNIKKSLDKIKIETGKALNQYKKIIILGGDHSITLPAFQALLEQNPKSGLIIFDAHPDLELHSDIATHEDWLRILLESNPYLKQRLILVGLRSFSKNETDFIIKHKIVNHYIENIMTDIHEFCDTIMTTAMSWDATYISIDVDVLDPCFMPGVVFPEPGGLSTKELFYIINRLKKLKNLRIIDIVEANPNIEEKITTLTTARLLSHLL